MTRARADAVLVAAVTAAVLAGLVGCGGGAPGEAAARRAELEAQGARLAAQLEVLEARLVDGQARVRAWQELRARHQAVSAVARGNAEWRVADMLRAREAEQVLVRAIRAPRLASAAALDPAFRTP